MAAVRNASLTKSKKKEQPLYKPSELEREVVSSIFYKFRNSADNRNRNFNYFDGLNLIEYIEDSVHRFTTNLDERTDIEDWQARVHDPFTRNKVLAILGKVVQVLPIAQFIGRGDEDAQKGLLLTSLYEYAEEVDDYEELMTQVILEAIVKGTAIGYEGLERKERKIRAVKNVGDDLVYTEKKEVNNRLFGAIIPLEDFYPQHVSLRNIKAMDYCFWRTVVPYQKFISEWGTSYAQAQYVQEKKVTDNEREDRPYYLDFISTDVDEGMVEIIRYYNKDTDEYVIVANGVWLNPITHKGVQVISPLPFNHKELPFWDIKFDFFGSDFFYGKSLPDRLKTLQDVLNVLTNMLLDQSFLTIFPPILTNGLDNIEDDYLRPGRRIPIDTQGMPITQAFTKLDLGTPAGWHQYILEYTRKIMEQSSIDQVSQGVAGVGGRTTAQEIRVAAEGVASMLGIFGRMINYGIKRKAMLKAANILQFWTDKNSPRIEQVLGDGGAEKMNKVFDTFRIDNTILTSGKRGTKIVEFYRDPADKPTRPQVRARAAVGKLAAKKNIEIVAVDDTYLRNFMFDVKLVSNPKQEGTRDLDKAMQLEKVRVYLTFFPELVDKEELAAQTAEKMGDDPAKIIKTLGKQPPVDPAQNPEAAKPIGTDPEMNMANNAVRQSMGGEMDSMQLRDLQNSMNG